jgi:hypothetical protein
VRRLVFVAAAFAATWLAPGALAAGWCGSGAELDDRPDIEIGAQIHAVYALPADGADGFLNGANALADDTVEIASWWLGQDPVREPRFDLAMFGECRGLDISFVRLPETGAAIAAANRSAFGRLAELLNRAGLRHRYKRYLVYYDGPPFDANVCGTASGGFDRGPSYAVIWLQSCPGVSRQYVAAHELLHALGAVPRGAPHPYSPFDIGHVSDSTQDILYPQARPGFGLPDVTLDVNHDDYYGHAGSWPDIQDSAWLHRLDAQPQPLTVVVQGTGRVASAQPGLTCGTVCAVDWDGGTIVTLVAEGTASTRFVGWGRPCTGIGDCTITVTQPTSVTAVFGPKTVPVRTGVLGRGRVVCSPRCSLRFHAGDLLTLRAMPEQGWRFAGWTGACRGRVSVCRPKTDFALSVRATFRRV